MHSAIYKTFFSVVLCIDILLIRGGGGLHLPWVYVHSSIYETYLVYWFSRHLWSIRGGGIGSACHGYMCILLYVQLIRCSGVALIYG